MSHTIKLQRKSPRIIIKQIGARGQQGEPGEPGPPGPSSGDKTFSQAFTVASTVSVTHNLHKYPSVIVIDSAGEVVEGSIVHTDTDSLVVSFNAPFSGTVICN